MRGGLLLVGVPKDYNNRYFVLLQNDRLTFGDVTRPDDQKNNIYSKIGYQFGTQFDERMNAIVGEQRGRITPVLTAFRDIGPQKTGLAAAITQAGEVVDRRLHVHEARGRGAAPLRHHRARRSSSRASTSASFLAKRRDAEPRRPLPGLRERRSGDRRPRRRRRVTRGGVHAWECYDIPQDELFRLGGREALKSISRQRQRRSARTKIHLTNELFVPIFRNRDYKVGPLHWNTLYGVGYVGAGTVGFLTDQITDSRTPRRRRRPRHRVRDHASATGTSTLA